MTARPARKRPWRRRALLCLFLGAATTIGVAWGFAATAPPLAGWPGWCIHIKQERAWEIVWVGQQVGTTDCSYHHSTNSRERRIHVEDAPAWAIAAAERTLEVEPTRTIGELPIGRAILENYPWASLPDAEYRKVRTRACGWPARALHGSEHDFGPDGNTVRLGYVQLGKKRLPVRPAWRSFLLDTLFYAAPWWLILITPGAIRRFRRRRRGRCIHCGYDLAGLRTDDNTTPTCPECGT